MENLRFRAWDKEDERMKEVFNLDFHRYTAIVGFRLSEPKSFLNDRPLIITQSTGLFDLDGNEIYIGDILKIEDEYTQVVFHEDNTTYGIYLEDKEGGGNPISDYSTRISLNHIKGTIKGNKFEHPYLLEGDNE